MTPLLQARGLSKTFPAKGRVLHAVSQVDLTVTQGETLALVGESGCGKSTLGRLLLGLLAPTQGQVLFDGQDLAQLSPAALRALRPQMQMVFQDAAATLNPRWTVAQVLAEPLRLHGLCSRRDLPDRCAALLDQVGLSPRLIVCDEPVSALDVSVQAQVLNLLADLQQARGLTYVLISHDLGVVRHSADRVCVMFLGRVCEIGPTKTLFAAPRHPYTRFLLAAVPRPDPTRRSQGEDLLSGELPSPVDPPSGCPFRTRCPYAQARCAQEIPALTGTGDHRAACHFPLEEP